MIFFVTSDSQLDEVGQLIKKAFIRICTTTCQLGHGLTAMELYVGLERYRCGARDFVPGGVGEDRKFRSALLISR